MRYAHFRSLGLAVGSGAVESSVRRVLNLRLKGASVAWLEEHAEGMLHFRAHAKSGLWPDLEDVVLANTGAHDSTAASSVMLLDAHYGSSRPLLLRPLLGIEPPTPQYAVRGQTIVRQNW